MKVEKSEVEGQREQTEEADALIGISTGTKTGKSGEGVEGQ